MCITAESVVRFILDSVQTHLICTIAIFKHPDLTCLCFLWCYISKSSCIPISSSIDSKECKQYCTIVVQNGHVFPSMRSDTCEKWIC